MSSEWSSEIWLAEVVLNSVHNNSLVPVNGRQNDMAGMAFTMSVSKVTLLK